MSNKVANKQRHRSSIEKFIYQTKQDLWFEHDEKKDDISSHTLSGIISEIEHRLLVAYRLGHKHGEIEGREQGFTEAIKTLDEVKIEEA